MNSLGEEVFSRRGQSYWLACECSSVGTAVFIQHSVLDLDWAFLPLFGYAEDGGLWHHFESSFAHHLHPWFFIVWHLWPIFHYSRSHYKIVLALYVIWIPLRWRVYPHFMAQYLVMSSNFYLCQVILRYTPWWLYCMAIFKVFACLRLLIVMQIQTWLWMHLAFIVKRPCMNNASSFTCQVYMFALMKEQHMWNPWHRSSCLYVPCWEHIPDDIIQCHESGLVLVLRTALCFMVLRSFQTQLVSAAFRVIQVHHPVPIILCINYPAIN